MDQKHDLDLLNLQDSFEVIEPKELKFTTPVDSPGLCKSLKTYGLLTVPIVSGNVVIEGSRRVLEAIESQRQFILIRQVGKLADPDIILAHVHLIRRPMTVLREAEALRGFKKQFDQEHPEQTKGGDVKAKQAKKEQNGILTFSKYVADLTDRSLSSIEKLVQIGSIPADVRAEIHKNEELANRQDRLLSLAICEKKEKVPAIKVAQKWIAHPDWTFLECVNAVKQEQNLEKPVTVSNAGPNYQIFEGDFGQVMANQIADQSIDCVITDPPYLKEYLHLLPRFARETARVLKPNGFALVMFGQNYLNRAIRELDKHLKWRWLFSDDFGGIGTPLPGIGVSAHWKPILVYGKNTNKFPKFGPDVIRSGVMDKSFHEWQQAIGPFEALVKRFTKPGDLILDPYLGSGTTMIAALKHGRRCWGIDINPNAIKAAKIRIQEMKGKEK